MAQLFHLHLTRSNCFLIPSYTRMATQMSIVEGAGADIGRPSEPQTGASWLQDQGRRPSCSDSGFADCVWLRAVANGINAMAWKWLEAQPDCADNDGTVVEAECATSHAQRTGAALKRGLCMPLMTPQV